MIKYYRTNYPAVSGFVCSATDQTITLSGTVISSKPASSLGYGYRAVGGEWTDVEDADGVMSGTVISGLTEGTEYELSVWAVCYGTKYRVSVGKITTAWSDPTISDPTISEVTSSGMKASGTVTYSGPATYGVAFKKSGATSWTHKSTTSKTIELNLTGLDAETEYTIALYAKIDGEYIYGDSVTETTLEAE